MKTVLFLSFFLEDLVVIAIFIMTLFPDIPFSSFGGAAVHLRLPFSLDDLHNLVHSESSTSFIINIITPIVIVKTIIIIINTLIVTIWQVSKSRGLVLLAVLASSISFLSRTLDRTYEIEYGEDINGDDDNDDDDDDY